jgi:hypothetical protein
MSRIRLGSIRPWWRRFKANGYKRDRCHECGHPFRWTRDARHGFGDARHFHGPCISLVTAKGRAADRLAVVETMRDLSGLTASDVQEAMGLHDGPDGWNRAWRVFYDLKKSAEVTR